MTNYMKTRSHCYLCFRPTDIWSPEENVCSRTYRSLFGRDLSSECIFRGGAVAS